MVCAVFVVKVVGVTEGSDSSQILNLLLSDSEAAEDRMVEISPDLWQPFEGKVEEERFFVRVKVCGKTVTEISLEENLK